MTREGTLFFANTGAKILCTDALGWDRPFPAASQATSRLSVTSSNDAEPLPGKLGAAAKFCCARSGFLPFTSLTPSALA
jgi:hypothetical protein